MWRESGAGRLYSSVSRLSSASERPRSRQAAPGRVPDRSGRRCAPTALRCSARRRAAELASFASLTALRHAAASQTTKRTLRARRLRSCAARRSPQRPGRVPPATNPPEVCAKRTSAAAKAGAGCGARVRRRAAQGCGASARSALRGLTCRACLSAVNEERVPRRAPGPSSAGESAARPDRRGRSGSRPARTRLRRSNARDERKTITPASAATGT